MSAPRRSRPAPRGYWLDAQSGSGLLDWSVVVDAMRAAKNYWVGSTRPDGRPHSMPVWGVWLDDSLAFSTSPVSVKARNLVANPHASIHLESGDRVVVVEGTVDPLRDPDWLLRFRDDYNRKYDWDFTLEQLQSGVYRLRPRKAFAWLGGRGEAFSGTGTRFVFDRD